VGGRPRKEVEFDVLISGYAPEYSHTVREYLALLELPMPADESKDIVLPVYFAVKGRESGDIGISTRSTIFLGISNGSEIEHKIEGQRIYYIYVKDNHNFFVSGDGQDFFLVKEGR
jgi:hypothetical protein